MASTSAARQFWKLLTEGKGFDRVLNKVHILSAEHGTCTAELKVSDEHTNVSGTLHGGLTSTIVDIISGVALSTHESNSIIGVSVDLHISFLKAVPIGQEILIEAKTTKAGRTLAFLEVLIKDKSSGKTVARGYHTKFVGK